MFVFLSVHSLGHVPQQSLPLQQGRPGTNRNPIPVVLEKHKHMHSNRDSQFACLTLQTKYHQSGRVPFLPRFKEKSEQESCALVSLIEVWPCLASQIPSWVLYRW